MSYSSKQDAEIARLLNGVIEGEDLTRTTWKNQTDAVKFHFIVAQMAAEDSSRLWLVDGRISTDTITCALSSKFASPKDYFAKRCHDKGLSCRRLIFLDTKSTNGMGKRANHKANLHFHAFLFLSEGETEKWLRQKLRCVFGTAAALGAKQFKYSAPDNEKAYTFSDRKGAGAAGKLNYNLSHAGASHRALELNKDGKRSRKAPSWRRKYNKNSKGLAAGVPSNFLRNAICDTSSKQEGKKAFDAWVLVNMKSTKAALCKRQRKKSAKKVA